MSYKTLILIDNTKTLTTLNREIVKETVKYLIKNADENTKFGISLVSDSKELIADFDDTKETKIKSLENIEYVEEKSSFRDAIMDVITDYKESDFTKREILVISDGKSSDGIYALEELYFELNNSAYPIFSLCCDQDDNTVDLRGLSSISRISGGKSFHTQFEGDDANVEETIGNNILSALQNYRELYRTEDSIVDYPGGYVDSKVPLEPDNFTSDPYEERVVYQNNSYDDSNANINFDSSVIYEKSHDKAEGSSSIKIVLYGLVIILTLFIVYLIGNKRKRKKEREKEELFLNTIQNSISQNNQLNQNNQFKQNEQFNQNNQNKQTYHNNLSNYNVPVDGARDTWDSFGTRCLNEEDEDDDGSTRLLYQAIDGVDITLEDRADPTKYFRANIRDRIVIGRSEKLCDIPLKYDDSVSGRHCELFLRGDNVYVRDLSSSNGTYVNGQKVYQEIEINSGDIIKLGQLSLFIQIIRRM